MAAYIRAQQPTTAATAPLASLHVVERSNAVGECFHANSIVCLVRR
jgi:hypothetical protein